MRYPFIALGVTLFLAACGDDPTGLASPPDAGSGRKLDPQVPIECLNHGAPVALSAKTGLAASVAIPPCGEPLR
jgi:hypothetical protein